MKQDLQKIPFKRFTFIRNDGKTLPHPTGEGWGEGATFAQQTETDLPSYRPDVLTTLKKLDCFTNNPTTAMRFPSLGRFVHNGETTLAPQYLSALVPSKKAAFTLAEVLITLGIIGLLRL